MVKAQDTHAAYKLARERYAELGVGSDAALDRLACIAISLHCRQGDDLRWFEAPEGALCAGIASTGNYPGRARNAEELKDLPFGAVWDAYRQQLGAPLGMSALDHNRRCERDALAQRGR